MFCETHLKAKPPNMEARTHSVNILKNYFSQNHQDKPVFIAGDFNEESQNEPIQIMKGISDDLYTVMQRQNNINDPTKMHPEFTTVKYRESEGWVKRTIDYISLYQNQYT